jgi:hypothetical protein
MYLAHAIMSTVLDQQQVRENEPEGFEWREALEEHMDNRYAGI